MVSVAYDSQHVVLRPFGNMGPDQVGQTIEIPDAARARSMVSQSLVRPVTVAVKPPFNPQHVVVRPFGNIEPGTVLTIEDENRARLMVEQHLVRPCGEQEFAELVTAVEPGTVSGVESSTAVQGNTDVLPGPSAGRNRKNARVLVQKHLTQLEE